MSSLRNHLCVRFPIVASCYTESFHQSCMTLDSRVRNVHALTALLYYDKESFSYCKDTGESYRKTLYFRCILISPFSHVENSLHFNLAELLKRILMSKFSVVLLFTYYTENIAYHITVPGTQLGSLLSVIIDCSLLWYSSYRGVYCHLQLRFMTHDVLNIV